MIKNTLFQYILTRNNTLFQDKFKGFVSLFQTLFAPFSTRHLHQPNNASPYVLLYPSFSVPLESLGSLSTETYSLFHTFSPHFA